MPPAAAGAGSSSKSVWKDTKQMNMSDLSRDDDFLSHLLVEKLGTGIVPLVVHKMDPTRELPRADPDELLQIVRRLVAFRGPLKAAIHQAVDCLLTLHAVKYWVRKNQYDQKRLNAFATHASRYFELYSPHGSIEIAHTSRYSHRTGKSELCILATRPLATGAVISELKGSMADLTEEEDKELKRSNERHADGVQIRRDFSVIHSKQLKKNHLFLGPARFVNHDCDHNVELFREGRYITFRVLRPIAAGEEVTAYYGPGYFGRKNCHCLCETCEKNGRGGYGPQVSEDDLSDSEEASPDESDAASGSSSESEPESDSEDEEVNVDERRTRRGVYAVVPGREAPTMELDAEIEPDLASDLTSLPESRSSAGPSKGNGLMTPTPEPSLHGWSQADESSPGTFKSVISTRAQKARDASTPAAAESISTHDRKGKGRAVPLARQLVTPPLTSDSGSASAAASVRSSSRLRSRATEKEPSSSRFATPVQEATTPEQKKEPEARTLRPRALAASHGPERNGDAPPGPSEAPRGVDGKPLPTCITCFNVLPVISVDSQVVWGLSLGRTGKRGRPRKHVNVECPRCMRHFAIYNVKWPERIASDGGAAFIPTPRSNTPMDHSVTRKVSHTALAALDRKLAVAASSAVPAKRPYNKRPREAEDENVRPAKKVKTSTGRPRGRPPKNKVGMSTKAKEMLNVQPKPEKPDSSGRRSGRTRVPSLKLRESEPPKRYQSCSRPPMSGSSSSLSPPDSEDNVPEPAAETEEAERPKTPAGEDNDGGPKLMTPKSRAVAAQPRESNGRFGKKATTNGRYMRKNFNFTAGGRRSRAQRAVHRTKVRSHSELKEEEVDAEEDEAWINVPDGEVEESVGTAQKRPAEDVKEEEDEQPAKKLRFEAEERQEDEEPSFRFSSFPRHKHGSGLLSAPTPLTFARRKWASTPTSESSRRSEAPDSLQSSTDDDTDLPVTPEDNADAPVVTVDSLMLDGLADEQRRAKEREDHEDEEDLSTSVSRPLPLLSASAFVGKLTLRPSPVNLARRRWAPPPPKFDDPIVEDQPSRKVEARPRARGSSFSDASDLSYEDRDVSGARSKPTPFPVTAPSHSDNSDAETSSEEDGDMLLNTRIAAKPAPHRTSLGSLSAGFDSNSDSELAVERLVTRSSDPSGSRPASSQSINTPPVPSPDMSPGMAWKRTVLLPTREVPYPPAAFTATLASSPTMLVHAGWDTASDTDS